MGYIEFPETDDPEILRAELEIAKEIQKYNRFSNKVALVTFIVLIVFIIIMGALFEACLWCGVYGGALCSLLS
jgi:hypothetical protein